MGKILVVCGSILGGIVLWRITNDLSADALGMAVGILFGMCAGIPAALLVLVAGRRSDEGDKSVDEAFAAGRRQGLLEAQSAALARRQESVWVVDPRELDETGAMIAQRARK